MFLSGSRHYRPTPCFTSIMYSLLLMLLREHAMHSVLKCALSSIISSGLRNSKHQTSCRSWEHLTNGFKSDGIAANK